MTKKRVLIACPAKGGLPSYWVHSLVKIITADHPLFSFDVKVETGHGAINIARNIIAANAIEMDYWAVGQIDHDMLHSLEDIVRLCTRLLEVEFVYAPYVRKESGPVKWLVVHKPSAVLQPNGLMECDFVGTGAHFSRVSALKAMCDFYPERRFAYDDEQSGTKKFMTELYPIGLVGPNTPEGRLARIKAAFESGCSDMFSPPSAKGFAEACEKILTEIHPGESRMLGEDYHFCHLARKAGFRLWSDHDHLIPHVGDCQYPISTAQLSHPAPFPTHTLNLDQY